VAPFFLSAIMGERFRFATMKMHPSLLSTLVLVAICSGQPSNPIQLNFGSVKESAGLDNPWRIEQHLPDLWREILDSLDGIQFSQTKNADRYTLDLIINEIEITKYHVGNPLVGGYQGYKAKIVTECLLRHASDHELVTRWSLNTELSDRQLGFTVLGQGIKHALTFTELDTLKFDSEIFQKSLIYRALVVQGNVLKQKMADYFGLDDDQKVGLGPYKVLISKNADFHINAGSAEGLVKDQVYSVYTEGGVILAEDGLPLGRESVLVGQARVMLVKGNHLTWMQFSVKSDHVDVGTEIFLQ